jgi:hypothetical protein
MATRLKHEHKIFLARAAARYMTPTDAAAAFRDEFGSEISKQLAEVYNPERAAGGKLADDLRKVFEEERRRYVEEVEAIPLASQAFRLNELTALYFKAKASKNYGLARDLMEQAAKERGGMFTNRREITGRGGGPIETHAVSLDDWRANAAARGAQAAETLAAFEEEGGRA